ncbi:unnamed protein product [Hymenolepis diminuta]|uniref:Uncharacterized protein n=1 Tax=Hymenolepis diminuta TaxID=6216 RepID=A0A564Y9F5_HYMDI|nr:unnamed protein product [Hymenolepis diminuta]
MSFCTKDAKPLSVMSKLTHRFPPFYNFLISLKSTSALMFSSILTQVTRIKLSLFFHSKQLAFASFRLLRLL